MKFLYLSAPPGIGRRSDIILNKNYISMIGRLNKDWWKYIFDEIYLLTDSRSVCNEELTRQEVDFIEQFVKQDKTARILDLCGGQGRHSLELSRRGYIDVTVLDYSPFLIDLGKQTAGRENLKVTFIRGDARDTGLDEERFRYIIVMAGSFGYFAATEENLKILKEISRLLSTKGKVLLDLPDRDYCLNNFNPYSRHVVDHDISVERYRETDSDIIYCREIVRSENKGILRDSKYCIRLFTPYMINALLTRAGLTPICVNTGFMDRHSSGDYGCMTNRMIVTAEKQ
jgi:D-alanine-D-alanine ligase